MTERDEQLQIRQSTMKKDNRLKSKFASANNAMAKARAFFRSFELKHHRRDKQKPSPITINTPSSDEDNQITSSTISKIDQINPRDMIVHRVINTDDKFPSNYFQQKYKQYLKPSLLLPRQYYNDLLNKRNYSSLINRYDFYSPSPSPSTANNDIPSVHYRPLLYREIKSPQSTWNQCVRRLNTEYRLTLDALEQAKECLKQVYSNPQYPANKKSGNVTFCLPSPPPISHHSIEQHKILPCIKFSKPKLIKPVELDTFSELAIIENDEKFDSVTNIIKKFNSLSSTVNNELIDNPRVHFQSSITTYEIPEEEIIPKNEPIVIVEEKPISSLSLKTPTKFISHIPKRIPTNTRLKSSSKINFSNKQKSGNIKTRIPNVSSRSSIPIKRTSRPK